MKAPKKPVQRGVNKFFWWRRFPIHKSLGKRKPIYMKIKNGDYDYSPYFQQADWELEWMDADIKVATKHCISAEGISENSRKVQEMSYKRRNKLLEDAMKDEHNRLESLKEDIIFAYGGDKKLYNEVIEKCDGDINQLVIDYKQAVKTYSPPITQQVKRKRGRPPKIR